MELDGLAFTAINYISHAVSLKVRASKGSYLTHLSIRTIGVDSGSDRTRNERTMDDLALEDAIWRDEHWRDEHWRDRCAMLKADQAPLLWLRPQMCAFRLIPASSLLLVRMNLAAFVAFATQTTTPDAPRRRTTTFYWKPRCSQTTRVWHRSMQVLRHNVLSINVCISPQHRLGAPTKRTPPPPRSHQPMRELRIDKLVITTSPVPLGLLGAHRRHPRAAYRSNPSPPRPATPSRRSVSVVTNRPPSKLPSVAPLKAEEILERGLKVKEYELRRKNFSDTGNFGFAALEHIARYDPGIGIFGMDFYVVMGLPGGRVAKRRAKKARIGFQHKVKEDTMAWFKQRFDVTFRCDLPYLVLANLSPSPPSHRSVPPPQSYTYVPPSNYDLHDSRYRFVYPVTFIRVVPTLLRPFITLLGYGLTILRSIYNNGTP
ncbi:hypothetical protein NMY22_g10724 [Coprinellus aureogranulatus]|nr:hypothetical protein NMY22_g10724 [Coprinellus aureogranulatus]